MPTSTPPDPATDNPLVYLNGRFLPLREATVSVQDRGFVLGDGVYEMVPVYNRVPFRLDEHLNRLDASLAAIDLPNPHSRAEWHALLSTLIAAQAFADQGVYIQLTRGVAPRDFLFPRHVTPTVHAMCYPLSAPDARLREQGVDAITVQDIRWLKCDIKAISLLGPVLCRQQAAEAGVAEALMIRDGWLTEGTSSNIFIVKAGVILTPPKTTAMLPGITYDVILELCATQHLPHEVRPIREAELHAADEIWLSSSTKEVLPIVQLDRVAVGDGKPGGVYKTIYAHYQDFKTRVMRPS